MMQRLRGFVVLLAALPLALVAGGCGSDELLPEVRISFQTPADGPLFIRSRDMLRGAQLEVDAVRRHTGTRSLRLVIGPDPEAVATINGLLPDPVAARGQLLIDLVPPVRREAGALSRRSERSPRRPRIALPPPQQLAQAARDNYAASGLPQAGSATVDSPLKPGTPDGTWVTSGMSADSYPPAGRAFFRKYVKRYGHAPDRFAIWGYEAVGLLIDAIHRVERAGEEVTQQSVAASALSIRNRFSPLGHYDVLPSGQTTLYIFQARGDGAPDGADSLIEALR